MLLAKYAELILAGICLGENFAVVLVAVGFNLFAAHTHQVVDLLAYRSKLLGVFCREWIEVVVHVLLDWVEHTAQRVDELLVAVGTQVEPGVALDGNLHRRFLQTEHLLATVLFQHILLLLQVLVGMTEILRILVGKTIHNLVELVECKVADEALGAGYLATKQIPYYFWIV